MALAAVGPKALALLLFFVAPIDYVFFVLGPCFVMRCCVSFLVLQSSRLGRDSWLLYVLGYLKLLYFI